jgi:hypothetical protein
MVKNCFVCKSDMDTSEFGKCSKNKDGLSHKCKKCKREYDNKFHNKRSPEAKKSKNSNQKERIKKIRKFMVDYLKDKSCSQCSESRMPTLDFHHLGNKEFNICDAVRKGYSLDKIKKEIEKCSILCSNCHRIETAEQFGWYTNI